MNNPIHRQRIMKSGWLRKQGGMVRTWHRRWFCLNGDCLFYFVKEDDLKPQGSIFLPGNKVTEIQWTPEDSDKYLFEICPDVIVDDGKSLLARQTLNSEIFQLCANNNEERQGWMKAIRKVIYSDLGGAIFGQSIEETMMYEHRCKRKIPYIIEQCVDFITQYGLDVEGIFRLPGRTTLIKELKDRFDCAEKIVFDISEHDVHSVASLLKMYFRELPESIIPSSYYQKLMNVAMNFQGAKELEKKREAVNDLKTAISGIPEDNYNIVQNLCQFLERVGEMSDINKMTVLNLATVFGPNIIRNVIEADSPELMMATADLTQQLCYMLISNCKDIFTDKTEETKPEVPVENLLDLSDSTEVADEPQPLPRVSLRINKAGSRGSSLLTSVTEELKKRGDNNILKPFSFTDSNVCGAISNREDLKVPDLLDIGNGFTKTENNNNNKSPRDVGGRQRPVPPVRRKKKDQSGGELSPSNSLSRTSSVEGTESIQDLKAEVERLKAELENTRQEYENKIQELKSGHSNRIIVLRRNNENAEKIYKQQKQTLTGQIEELKKDLAKEKQDRNEAVDKVMSLQTELNKYHLQYGQLH